jgi:hypothetical protein
MITTRKFLRMAVLLTAGTLVGCGNDATLPTELTPIEPLVFSSLEMQTPAFPLVPVPGLSTSRIEVRPRDQKGRTIYVETEFFTITSSNPAVVAVVDHKLWNATSNGVAADTWIAVQIEALAPGEAVISASWTIDGVTKTAKSTITVESTDGWSLNVAPAALSMELGSTRHIDVSVVDAHGNTRIRNASFTSDREGVLGFFEYDACLYWVCYGTNVRGLALGETTVTARFMSLSAALVVKVVPPQTGGA